jgi:broad specificity phosphatase PhoE
MLIVVRHGRTTANAEGRLLGRLDPDLDDAGVAQAEAVAEWIGPVDRVVTSPLVRAVRTAEAFGCAIEVDERWVELDYGEIDGRPASEVSADVWATLRSDPHWRPPGGESLSELNARVTAACQDLAELAVEADVVVVTHVSPIKAVVSWALGGVVEVPWRTRVGQPSITRVSVGPSGPVLQSFNEAPK